MVLYNCLLLEENAWPSGDEEIREGRQRTARQEFVGEVVDRERISCFGV